MNPQIESLRKTTTTKQQVIEKIQAATVEELRIKLPSLPVDTDKQALVANADRLLNAPAAINMSDLNTEALVLVIGRPVLLIEKGKPVLIGDEIEKWTSLITNAEDKLHLLDSIKSVGRIETLNLPGYKWLATGWMVSEDLMVTTGT